MKIKSKNIKFEKRKNIKEIEEGNRFSPRFNDDGLIPCVTIEKKTKDILMFSFLNKESLKKSISSGKAHYFSRSRKKLWLKGETSGMYHDLKEIFIDDDQDSIIFVVSLKKPNKGGNKASCHVGYKSCFYRKLKVKKDKIVLEFTEKEKAFNPDIIYKGISNPTKI